MEGRISISSHSVVLFVVAFASTITLILSGAGAGADAGTALGLRNVYILAGQSNMAGRGGNIIGRNGRNQWGGITPPECQPNPRILRLNNDLLWEEAHEPLHDGISFAECIENDQPNGIGPGMPFSNTLLARDPLFAGVIGLVPCAVGGTNITQWSRGSCLYNRMLRRVRAAQQQGGVLRGLLWYQGESDTDSLLEAELYGRRLETFFTDLRRDLLHPWLPIIQVALASGGTNTSLIEIVRQAQLNTALPKVKCVDAAGLPLNGDKLHLTTDSQIRLGSMMGDVFLRYFHF